MKNVEQKNIDLTVAKNLLVLVGFTCNNNCIMCSIKDKDYPDRKFTEIFKDLEKGNKQGYKTVEFSGGEPTIRKDIVNIINSAKKLGYQTIAFSTNGRLFSYDKFCHELIEAGLNKITFSLLGPSAEIHDSISRAPGSFDQIIRGIKNIQKYPSVHINVSSVISKLNFFDLKKFGNYILSLSVKNWYLLDLIPDGNTKKFYKNLVVKLNDLEKELNSLSSLGNKFDEFGFFDFPLCLFSCELRKKQNACFVNAKMREESSLQVGYGSTRISKDKQGVYTDAYRINIDICAKCLYHKECGGVWKKYLDLYGEDEVIKLAKRNKCLICNNKKKL